MNYASRHNFYSGPELTASEATQHDSHMYCGANPQRVKDNAVHLGCVTPDGFTPDQAKSYYRYLYGDEVTATLQAMLSAAFRKEPKYNDHEGFLYYYESAGQQTTNPSVLARDLVTRALNPGCVYALVDATPDKVSIITYAPHEVVQVKTRNGEPVYLELDDMNASQYDTEKEKHTLIIEKTPQGVFSYVRGKVSGSQIDRREITARGRPLDFIPFMQINAYNTHFKRYASPLYALLLLSVQRYDLMCQHAHALSLCASPQPWVSGIAKESEIPTTWGSSRIIALSQAEARVGLAEPAGNGMEDRAKFIKEIEGSMVQVGMSLIQPRGNLKYQVAASIDYVSREDASKLVEILRNVEIAINKLLQWVHLFAPVPMQNKPVPSVNLNLDLVDQRLTSDYIRVVAEMQAAGQLSYQTLIRLLQQGEVLPEDIDPDEELQRIETDPTSITGREAPIEDLGEDGNDEDDDNT